MKALGIDIGTTTISAAVWNTAEEEIGNTYTISNGSFVSSMNIWEKIQDPELIIAKTKKLLEEIFEENDDIGMIGLTGQMHGIVYLDEEGNSVSPLYTWQDRRGNEPCFDGKSVCDLVEEKTGEKVPTGYGLVTHIYNMKKGIVPKSASQMCTIMDYLGMVLTDRKKPLIHSSNASSLGFFDEKNGCFLKEKLKIIGVDSDILPEISEDFCVIGAYKEIPVGIAIGDNQASVLGAIKNAGNTILVNMGTGGQISVISDMYFKGYGIEARPFTKGKYLLAGSSLCGGRAYATLAKFFEIYADAMGVENIDHYKVMEKLLAERKPEEKLDVDTTFSGTREHPDKRGSIKNISAETFTPAALIYGVLDGMAEELYQMYVSIVKGTGAGKKIMVASGNGIRKNKILQGIMSEKFHMELQMAENEEEAAIGAAKAALIASGKKTVQETIGLLR